MARALQSNVLIPRGVVIHDTHYMEYAPCLFLECTKCFLSVKNNADELAFECTEDVHEINNTRVAKPYSQKIHGT